MLPSELGAVILYENERMKFCPYYGKGCGWSSEDEDVLATHVISAHMEEDLKSQGKLTGGKVTEDDRKFAILSAIPDESYQCPFCFAKFPHSKVCRYFLDGGKLSPMAVCHKASGGCGKRMQASSMKITRGPPLDFGRWVGAYAASGYWKIVNEETFPREVADPHKEWTKRLYQLYPQKALSSLFWEGYAYLNPKFAEKQKEKQMLKDALESGQISDEPSDQVNEFGK